MPLPHQRITGAAQLAGVVGCPVRHSLSPVLHNYWLSRQGIDGAYIPLHVRSVDFEDAIYNLQKMQFRGVNVTIPHKEHAFKLAQKHDRYAQLTGSVNTLIFSEDGVIHGSSTDGEGFVASLEAHGEHLGPQTKICLLGAGGAARSVAFSLAQRGCTLVISNRHLKRAQTLAQLLRSHHKHVEVVAWHKWQDLLEEVDMLVNTTSLGMVGGPDPGFAPALEKANSSLVVVDCVYTPLTTPLLHQAKKRECKIIGGLGMLLYQAGLGYEAWFGQKAVIDRQTYDYVSGFLI